MTTSRQCTDCVLTMHNDKPTAPVSCSHYKATGSCDHSISDHMLKDFQTALVFILYSDRQNQSVTMIPPQHTHAQPNWVNGVATLVPTFETKSVYQQNPKIIFAKYVTDRSVGVRSVEIPCPLKDQPFFKDHVWMCKFNLFENTTYNGTISCCFKQISLQTENVCIDTPFTPCDGQAMNPIYPSNKKVSFFLRGQTLLVIPILRQTPG